MGNPESGTQTAGHHNYSTKRDYVASWLLFIGVVKRVWVREQINTTTSL